MSKYRFKTREEFIRDRLWDKKYNCPYNWAWVGQMNKYLGMDVPDELSVYCNKKEEFKYDGWIFQNTDYILKEQHEYFNDLSQHIGRYIRALVDYPHSGRVKKGEIGKIISNYDANFPSQQEYSCSGALSKGVLGVKYELLPEDYSPEQKTTPERISFYVKYTKEFTEDLYNALWEWSKKNSEFSPRNFAESYEGLKIHKFYVFDNWTLICYGVDNNKQSCEEEYTIEQVKKLIGYKEPNVEFIPGKWYKWYQKNHGNYHYGKVKEINITTDTLVMTPWIMQCDNYNYSGTFDLSKAEQIQEISVEDIQEFLPKNHSDKISKSCINEVENLEFKKGEYIVITDKFDNFTNDFIPNHIYKQRCNSNFLQPEYDSLNSTTNGWRRYTRNNTHNWRYATQEEIDEYERRGKPYNVTELQKKELSMEEIQEECKKRFLIGCTFMDTNEEDTHVLKTEIPEYIECTETQESYFIKGNIYKVIDSSSLTSARLVSNIELSQISAGTHLFCSMEIDGKKYWNPSTKEAYEQQKPLTYESVSGCFPTDKTMFIYDEVGQYPSTFSDYWKNVPKFVEKEFDIYGPTPDIE